MKFTFICEHSADLFGPKTTNTHVIDGEQTVNQLLERFEDFLKGCGYVIDGHFEVVDNNLYGCNPDYRIEPFESTFESIHLDNYYPDCNLSFSVADDIIKLQDC